MNIGDRVRMLRGKEEGIITKIIDSKTVEMEIEDGFAIPVLRNEVVIISSSEKEYFGGGSRERIGDATPVNSNKITSDTGIYIGYVPTNDQNLSGYIINNTDWTLPFVVMEEHNEGQVAGKSSGNLLPRAQQKIGDWNIQGFENWPPLIIQILFTRNIPFTAKQALNKRIKPKAASFFKSKKQLPILNKEGFLIQLDGEEVKKLDPAAIKAAMMDGEESSAANQKDVKMNFREAGFSVDLHAEKLFQNLSEINTSEILGEQIKAFEKALDKALESGAEHCIFIHGVGNGVLRNEIHKNLSKHPHVKFFEDTDKGKFGYGATKAVFK